MTGTLPTHVSIKVLPAADFTRVEFSAGRAGVPPLTLTLEGRDRLERALEEVDAGLLRLKEVLPALDASDTDLARAYTVMEDLGDTLWYTLFGNDEAVIHGVKRFWVSALPFARDPGTAPLVVECVGNTPFPVDYLPLLGAFPARSAESRAELLDRFRAFVGFSCQVQRKLLIPQSAASLRLDPGPDGRLPVRYLHYEPLPGASDELSWFRSSAGRIQLEGPYPDGQCTVPLPELIFDPRVLLSGSRRDTPDQIQHFSCHCYTKARSPLDSEIELSGAGVSVRLPLRDIGRDLVKLARQSATREYDLPLVFLNACGSARMRADSAFSFPLLFLQNRNRGFIGTEIDMPDDVAAKFSQGFYERFLNWGMPLGRALLETRRYLLYKHGNPLGIAYAAYADPELNGRPLAGGEN